MLGIIDGYQVSKVPPSITGPKEIVTAGCYLVILSALLLGCGISLLVKALVTKVPVRTPKDSPTRLVSLVMLIYVLYVFSTPVLGYLLSTFVFFALSYYLNFASK
jgi:hypothetical protein